MIQVDQHERVSKAVAWPMPGVVAALRAPLECTALRGGAIAGYVIRDEVSDLWVAGSAMIIIAPGLFVVYRSEDAGART